MRKYVILLVLLFACVACSRQPVDQGSAPSSSLRPSQVVSTIEPGALPPVPEGNFFYSLPTYGVGETVRLDGYTARLNGVELTDGQLIIDLDLGNNSGKPVDLIWAVQLLRDGQGYVSPSDSPVADSMVGESFLANSDNLGGVWTYELAPEKQTEGELGPQAEVDLDEYRLLFVPFGWSGPIFVFRLDPTMQ